MGKESSDIEREVEWIRRDTSAILDELEHRILGALDAGKQVREHPMAVGTAGTAFTVLLGLIGFAVFNRARERRRDRSLVKQYLHSARDLMARQAEELKQVLPIDVELRPVGARSRQKEGLFKRLLFSALASVVSALASYGAERLSNYLWAKYRKESPPVVVP